MRGEDILAHGRKEKRRQEKELRREEKKRKKGYWCYVHKGRRRRSASVMK